MFIHQKSQGQQKGCDLIKEEILINRRPQMWEERELGAQMEGGTVAREDPIPLRPEGGGQDR